MGANTARLYSTTDAQVWAEEWCNVAKELEAKGAPLIDEGWMIGWFANAIETSRNIEAAVGLGVAQRMIDGWLPSVNHRWWFRNVRGEEIRERMSDEQAAYIDRAHSHART